MEQDKMNSIRFTTCSVTVGSTDIAALLTLQVQFDRQIFCNI